MKTQCEVVKEPQSQQDNNNKKTNMSLWECKLQNEQEGKNKARRNKRWRKFLGKQNKSQRKSQWHLRMFFLIWNETPRPDYIHWRSQQVTFHFLSSLSQNVSFPFSFSFFNKNEQNVSHCGARWSEKSIVTTGETNQRQYLGLLEGMKNTLGRKWRRAWFQLLKNASQTTVTDAPSPQDKMSKQCHFFSVNKTVIFSLSLPLILTFSNVTLFFVQQQKTKLLCSRFRSILFPLHLQTL